MKLLDPHLAVSVDLYVFRCAAIRNGQVDSRVSKWYFNYML